jgi:hypothetical protein
MNTAIIKTDCKTKKRYFANNIPVGRLTTCKYPDGRYFKIFAENGTGDMWYNGRFLGDRYAVFEQIRGTWFQASKWYSRYGYAIKVMCNKF